MTTIDMKVRNIITMLAPDNRMEPVFPSETLEGLGFDSLARHTIALAIEDRFQIDLDDGVPEAWTTVQDVMDSVLNELAVAEEVERFSSIHHGDMVEIQYKEPET